MDQKTRTRSRGRRAVGAGIYAIAVRVTAVVPGLSFGLCALVMAGSLMLGGGTRSGFFSDAALQLLSIPLLVVSLWRLLPAPDGAEPVPASAKWGLAFCTALALVPLLQLVPLPPAVWTALPNREVVVEALRLAGAAGDNLPWMPLSIASDATWLSVVSLIPPIAVFLGTQRLGYADRRRMSLVVLAVGLAGAFLGLLQVAEGPSSPLRLFAVTNQYEAVGFFANRNHFAALLYSLLLLATCWTADAVLRSGKYKEFDGKAVAAVVLSTAVLIVLLSAQAVARSRAGLALTTLALIGAFALTSSHWHRISRGTARLIAAATAVGLLVIAEFTVYRIMDRFAFDPLDDNRIQFARNTLAAARDYLPFGAGMGSFIPVYAMYENPDDLMINMFANRAHNDVLEAVLEAGILGIGLMVAFAVCVVWRSVALWRSTRLGSRDIDLWLARAATMIVLLLALHSFVDYPLRTAAVQAIMAFASGLLVPPLAAPSPGEGARKRPKEKSGHGVPVPDAVEAAARTPGGGSQEESNGKLWGEDITWPEAWCSSPRG